MPFKAPLVLFCLALSACSYENTSVAQEAANQTTHIQTAKADQPAKEITASSSNKVNTKIKPNILILIADDMGVDTMGLYGLSNDTAQTPNLDRLASAGTVFKNAWATPACSTTRAALLTGKYGINNGVTAVPATLPTESQVIHQQMGQNGYANAAFGKWHLAGRGGSPTHPNSFGIERYEGNLQGNLPDYYNWTKTTNGQNSQETVYHTSAMTTATANWINQQDKPWLAWVAYSAPHAPIHMPPSGLHSRKLNGNPDSDARNHYLAAIEAMDKEIGRLLDAIPAGERESTIVFFIGDNGTPRRLIDRDVYKGAQGKSSLYEGGINVPFIVSGASLAKGKRSAVMVNIVDIAPTVMELTGASGKPAVDGQSFVNILNDSEQPVRSFNYAEYENGWTVRDANFKFIRQSNGTEELYDLRGTHTEVNNVLALSENTSTADSLRQYGLSIRGEAVSTAPAQALSALTNTSPYCADYVGNYTATGHDVARSTSFEAEISIGANAASCTISSNSIPNHNFNDGPRAFPNETATVKESFTIPRSPVAATSPTPLSLRVDNAIMLNGVKVDVIGAGCYGVGSGKIGCNDMATPWRYDPMNPAAGFNVDSNNAHTQPDGAYHYHGPPPITTGSQSTASGTIGFAADGFPIYGSWFRDGNVITKARSSYRLKSGARPSDPGGAYDGRFRDDYEYVAGLGDLDECNGQTVNGQYGYYVSEGYPYIIGCFTGTPHPSFTKSSGGQRGEGDQQRRPRDGVERRRQRRDGVDRPRRQRDNTDLPRRRERNEDRPRRRN